LKLYEWLALLTHIESVLLKRRWKRKETIIFLKLVHQKEYSHPFFISGVSVTVARLSFQIGGGGQHLSPLFVVVKTRYLDVPSKSCKIYFKKIDKLYDGMVFSRGFSPKQSQ
jgi:hypothetical protein